MKSKLAIAVTLLGWILLVAYIFYDYVVYGDQTIRHLFQPPHSYELFFHILIGLAPFISTTMGYFVNEKKKSEEKYRDLYQNAPDGYHSIGANGTIREVNDTWLKMLGYERNEVIGRMKITDILNKEGLRIFEKTYPAFKEKGYIENVEFDFRKKDGGFLPVIINATAIYDVNGNFLKSRSIVRDNTIKKGYEKILIRSSEEWRETFDAMPYGVMLLDNEFNIVRTNRYIETLSGIPFKELISRKCYEIIHKQDKPIDDRPLLKSIKSQNAETCEYFEPTLNKHFLLSVTPVFDEEGITIAHVHSIIDITDLKDKEKKLIESRNAFLNMLRDMNIAYTELKNLHNDLILAFANAIDAKSPWTKGHSERVSLYAVSIAKEMGLSERKIEDLRTAGLLHDIGKIGTYDIVLDKPDRLTAEEFDLVKMHPAKGEEILMPIKQLMHILPIIRYHHERMDGSGYPDRLKGDEIPLLAKILCAADSFDSMTADRPYRPAPGKEYAIAELKRYSGTQFDPEVVEAFLRVID